MHDTKILHQITLTQVSHTQVDIHSFNSFLANENSEQRLSHNNEINHIIIKYLRTSIKLTQYQQSSESQNRAGS